MTESQRLYESFIEASGVFDDDVMALSIALSGFMEHAGKREKAENINRSLNNGRYKRYEHFFPKVDDMSIEEVEDCIAMSQLRFAKMLGHVKEVEKMAKKNKLMPVKLIGQERNNITNMIKHLANIREELTRPESTPQKQEHKNQGRLF